MSHVVSVLRSMSRVSCLPRASFVVLAMIVSTSGTSNGDSSINLPAPIQAVEDARVAAIKKASASTLAIFGTDKASGGGSGVLISADGFALTNFHVAQPCGSHLKCGMNDGQLYDAVIVGIDPTGDLALIQLIGRGDFPPADIGDSDIVQVGDECFAVGNPFLLATNLEPTVTYGVVSGIKRYQPPAAAGILEYTNCIQTDAAINPGNSGGPLFNADGQLIGINGRGSFEKRGRVNVGVGYAISIRQALNFLGVLESGRVVDHATLGATVATDNDQRTVITNILSSSDAYRRGLRYGDEVLSIWGRPIDDANTFKNVLGILPRGWRVPVAYRRDGTIIEKHVRLAGVHSPEVLLQLSQENGGMPTPRVPDGRNEEELPEDGAEEDGEAEDATPNPPDGESPEQNEQLPIKERLKRIQAKRAETNNMPSHVAELFEQRRGYANYHYNKTNRERVWRTFSDATDSTGDTGSWTLNGTIEGRGTLTMTLDDDQLFAQSELRRDRHERVTDLSQGLAAEQGPAGSGGMYIALHLWRRLLTVGPAGFGEVYYWGTAPLPNHEDLFDVLVATHDVVESRFYFDRTTGRLIALEMFPDIEVDPCELYFSNYQETNGRRFPMTIEVRFGDDAFGVYELDSIRFGATESKGA